MKVDKAVCTSNDTLDDLQRAIRYETVFSTLVEKKILAIKRECEAQDEKKRAQREQACFAGRFFRKRRLGSKDQSSGSGIGSAEEAPGNGNAKHATTETTAVDGVGGKSCTVKYTSNGETESGGGAATATVIITQNSNDAVAVAATTETTNNDDECQPAAAPATCDENDAVQDVNDDSAKQCNGSGGSSSSSVITQRALTKSGRSIEHDAKPSPTTIDNANNKSETDKLKCVPPQPTKDTLNPTTNVMSMVPQVKVVTGSPVSNSSRLEVSNVSDDATKRKVSSDTTISFPSSCKQTTFSAPEVLTVNPADHERHRLRVLEAKSISAQNSPIFPRHGAADNIATQVSYRNEIGVCAAVAGPSVGAIVGARSKGKKLFTRQNTSDDSVNVTFNSVVLNDDGTEIISVADNAKKSGGMVGKRGSKKDKSTRDPLGFISNFNQLTAHNNLPVIATQLRAVNTAKLQRYLTTANDGSDCIILPRPKSTDDRFHVDGAKDKMVKAMTGQPIDDDEETKKNKRKSSEYPAPCQSNISIQMVNCIFNGNG